VKNQYFADRRDLFKYDLLLDLVESHGANRLTFVPMLTPDEDSGEGRLTRAAGRGRRELLYEFLTAHLESGQRDIRGLREVMPKFGVELMAFRDDAWFTQKRRAEYFDAVPEEYLARSVIFLDPDIGLETGTVQYMRRNGPEKYLLYSELTKLWRRASTDSIVVVYQHLQKDARKRPGDVERRVSDLQRRLEAAVWAVQWNDFAFLVAARDDEVACHVRTGLLRYAQRHALAFREGPDVDQGEWDHGARDASRIRRNTR
jgi:hypothetical protein